MVRIGFRIHDTGTADLSAIFPSPWLIIKVTIGTLLFICTALLGLLLFVLPGIYFLVRAWFYLYAIIDGDGIFEAFSTSFRITRGKGWQIYALLIIAGILGPVTWVFGGFVIVLSSAYIYRLLKKTT